MTVLTEKQALRRGVLFQFPMIVIYIASLSLFDIRVSWNSIWMLPSHAGALLFIYCLLELYIWNRSPKKLLTSGPFKYTRHPMYTGLALMDIALWLPTPPLSFMFYALQAAFVACMIMAALYQEEETLARFGEEAEAYYAKTPRFFFMYPFWR